MAIFVFHYAGGKANIAPWIADLLPPPGRYGVFVDVFGGAANMMFEIMRRNGQAGERPHYVYNDKDEELVNFFLVLRNKAMREKLQEMLYWTPYSRKQFCDCIEEVSESPVRRAWRFFTLQQQIISGLGVDNASPGRWAYDAKKKGGSLKRWLSSQNRLDQFGNMFRQVQIECLDFTEIINRYNSNDILLYVDPPYFPDVCYKGIYSFELYRERHKELGLLLNIFPGMAAISGYRCPEYDRWYANWERYDREVPCQLSCAGSTRNLKDKEKPKRIESVWFNAAAVKERCKTIQKSLF